MEFLKNNKRFSFSYDGKNIWDYEMTTKITENSDSLVTEYLLSDGLKITNIAKKYPAHRAYEWVTWFENTGSKPTGIISELNDADITIPFPHEDPYQWTAFLGDTDQETKIYSPNGSTWDKYEFYCDVDAIEENHYPNHVYPGVTRTYQNRGGRSSDKKAPFFNVHSRGVGVVFAIGWSGQWNASIGRDTDNIHIQTKIEDTHFRLLACEKIRTSSFVMMNYACDYDEAQNKWRRLDKEHFSLFGTPGRDKYLPLCGCVWGGMSSEKVIERVNIIKENQLPYEYIWMDAGWYGDSTQECIDEFVGDWAVHTGNWTVNKTYHPDGLKEVSKAIKDAGMKFLLWFEPERVVSSTPIASVHPEYFIGLPNVQTRALLLNLGNEAAWQYCYELLVEKIEELGIDCYRQDFNFPPLEYWRAGDAWDRKGMTEIKHITGLYRLWDTLLEKFPHLVIDNCASGGRRIDIELLRRSAPLWRSDAQCPADWLISLTQLHNMNFNTWLPYSATGSGREWGDVYRFRSAYAAGLTTNYSYVEACDFGKDPAQMAWIRKYCAEYLKVRPYFSADYYPLTDRMSADDGWCASQFNRPEEADGMLQVFKRENSPYTVAMLKLRGLDAEATYEFADADDDSVFTLSGKQLMTKGLRMEIEDSRVAKLFFYVKK